MSKPSSSLICLALALAVVTARAADFVVINTNPSGPGSLNQAITDANNLRGADRILFNIPGPGVHKIDVGPTPLPHILESLVIDGYSQPGAKPNSLAIGDNAVILIQIDGTGGTGGAVGLSLQRSFTPNGQPLAADYAVRGLSLTGFVGQQTDPYTQLTSYSTALGAGGDSAAITGNFIGLLPDGQTARGNSQGVATGAGTVVGGTDPAARNVISGNVVYGCTSPGVVKGNYIGTDASGMKAVPNATGIWYVGSNGLFGGTEPGAGNVVSGNDTAIKFGGNYYTNYPYPHNDYYTGNSARVQGNFIGVAADGVSPLPNDFSISLRYGSNNLIGGIEPGAANIIAFNGFGVNVASSYSFCAVCGTTAPPRSEGNQILNNSIYSNAGLAIDLSTDGPTANHPNDPDPGPNTLQNAPVITSTQIANGSATINCTFNSTPNTQFAFQYFSESLDLIRPVQTYLGSVGVSTDADGNAQVSAVFPVTDTNVSFNVTATSAAGNTSEFARNPGTMENLSTRALVQQGENVTIAGFILSTDEFLIVRALGPSLHDDFGLTGVLSDPFLEVYDSTGKLITSNDNWRESGWASTIEGFGLAPKNDLESATGVSAKKGSTTVVVRHATGGAGLGLVEVYKTYPSIGQPMNLSTRGVVGTGNNVMIAGMILGPGPGTTRIVARALGPSLAAAGIAGPLPDPTIELRDGQGGLIAMNDNWRDGQADALSAVGLAPADDKEAAIFTRLPPGAYTAIVRGKGTASGVALVEWYNLH